MEEKMTEVFRQKGQKVPPLTLLNSWESQQYISCNMRQAAEFNTETICVSWNKRGVFITEVLII